MGGTFCVMSREAALAVLATVLAVAAYPHRRAAELDNWDSAMATPARTNAPARGKHQRMHAGEVQRNTQLWLSLIHI